MKSRWTTLRQFAKSTRVFVILGVITGVLGGIWVQHVVRLAGAPRLELSRTRVDLGEVAPEETVSQVVSLRNIGKKRLDIQDIKTSCGCTLTKAEKTALAPGEASQLEISFIASSSQISTARVTIVSNDPRDPVQFIDVVAKKPLSATVAPRTILFHGLDRASLPTMREVFVTMTRADLFEEGDEITATSSSGYVAVNVVAQPDHLRCVIEVTLLETSPTGSYRSKIHLEDRKRLVNDDVEVDVRTRSDCFVSLAGFVVCLDSQDGENLDSQEFVVPHLGEKEVRIKDVAFGTVLRDVLRAEIVDSADKTKSIIRIRRKQQEYSDTLPDLVNGHLLLHVDKGKGNAAEVFCIPVTWCNREGTS